MLPSLDDLHTLARQAGQIIRAGYGQEYEIKHKGLIDIVTTIDKEAENFLIGEIQRRFPGHRIVAEESGSLAGEDEHCWYVDPIDGTVNFAHGVPIFAVSIGYARRGEPVLGAIYLPILDELYSAEHGQGAWLNGKPIHVSTVPDLLHALLVTGFPYDIMHTTENNLDHFVNFSVRTQGVRRLGSAAIDLAYVAAGRLDGFWEIRLNPWDVAAGVLIVREAGGVVTNLQGGSEMLTPPVSVVAANPAIYPQMMDLLRK